MRIIGGEFRGRKIKMPKAIDVRPTQDRVRESIFNIIREKVPGSHVLDLYAGSGAFGIEALSRGANFAIFVDNNIDSVKAIKKNLSILKIPGAPTVRYSLNGRIHTGRRGPIKECLTVGGMGFGKVFKEDAVKAVKRLKKEGYKFDIIFLDPPYYKDMAKNSLIKIGACDIVSQHGFVIAEHFKKDAMPEEAENLLLFKERRYGDTVLSFYRKK